MPLLFQNLTSVYQLLKNTLTALENSGCVPLLVALFIVLLDFPTASLINCSKPNMSTGNPLSLPHLSLQYHLEL